jgi:hypothetical protein
MIGRKDQVAGATVDLRRRLQSAQRKRRWPPAFFGMGIDKHGRTDISEKVDEILAVGFGAPRS